IDGDQTSGVRSLPVQLGEVRAGQIACVLMLLPQIGVTALLVYWGQTSGVATTWHALAIAALIVVQGAMMLRFLSDPTGRALWYSACGVPLFVGGMMIAAFAVAPIVANAGGL
ncbi:MAG: bacteriochlorophyll/chlorophyll a synthase, partial [Pseudomonadota bacterium]